MHRRDFLLLRPTPKSREAELSCEWLYMKYLDSQVSPPPPGPADSSFQYGEPQAVFDIRTPRMLFDDLDRQLREVDTVRVTQVQWLRGDDLRREVENLLRAFRARGGRIEIADRDT